MKTLKFFLFIVSSIFISFVLSSCLKDDYYSLDSFRVSPLTIYPQGENSYYLVMDDGTTLWPAASNYTSFQPKKIQRALVNYTVLSDAMQGYDHFIKVNRIDTFLTKSIAENLGSENDNTYGKDPVDIVDLWVGDGFLNVYFGTQWGGKEAHFINLIEDSEGSSSYELEFRHHAFEDPKISYGRNLVAFDLSSLPDTEENIVELKIKVRTYEGEEIFKVKYNSNGKVNGTPEYVDNVFAESLIHMKNIE
ncbi:MAG: NigD-like protein [Tannerellaceae bacterium]|nr:NigD-like protein [Tannerellaceae bacterium]